MVISGFLGGPFLGGLVYLVAFALVGSTGLSADVMNDDGSYSWEGAVVSVLAKVLFYYTSAIGVVVFCDAYRRVDVDEAQSDAPARGQAP